MKSVSMVALLLGIASVFAAGLTVMGLLVAYVNHKQPQPFWDARPSKAELMLQLRGKSGPELMKECESIVERVVACNQQKVEAFAEYLRQEERLWALVGKWLLGILAWSCVCTVGFSYIYFVTRRLANAK